MNPILHHEFVTATHLGGPRPAPKHWMLVMAGIYGAGRNWASIARRFVQERPEWGCVLVDLRQHGQSKGFSPPHSVSACAHDVLELIHHLRQLTPGVEVEALLGHSFGGKVALLAARLAESDPNAPLMRAIWVVDSAPGQREPEGSAWSMIHVLRDQPGPFENRDAAVRAVEGAGFPRAVGLWMSTNLTPAGDDPAAGLVWRLSPDDMEALLRSFYATDAWPVIEDPPAGAVVHVIKARDSNIISDDDCARVEAAGLATAQARLHRVQGGHWVNADDPEALQRLLTTEMP
jgi:esterase